MRNLRAFLEQSSVAKALLFALVYYAVARSSLLLSFSSTNASPVWPPSGIALAGVLLGGPKFGAGVFVAAFAANLATFVSNGAAPLPAAILASAAIAVGNLAECLFAAGISRRFIRRAPTDTLQGAYIFVPAAFSAGAVSASCGSAALVVLGIIPDKIASTVWLTWWLGDVTGMLVVTPLLLQLGCGKVRLPPLRPLLFAVMAFLLAGALTFGGALATVNADRLLAYSLVVFIAWTAYRHGRAGAAAATFCVAALSIFATVHGAGPFSKSTVNDSLVSLDEFLALCAATGMVLAASLHPVPPATAEPASTSPVEWSIPATILLACLGGTVITWHLIALDTERRSADRFRLIAEDIQARVQERLRVYEQALRGARGMFDVSTNIDRRKWHDYVEALAIIENYPGIQGMGFAARVSGAQRQGAIASARAEGLTGYDIRPQGVRAEYAAVRYLEPLDERNRRAIGYDLLSEPVRRSGLIQARDSGQMAITGKIKLVQDVDGNAQAGFLMFLPVYRHGLSLSTAGARHSAVLGYVYSPFRMGDFMKGILERADLPSVALTIFDGESPSGEGQLFANRGAVLGSYYPRQASLTLPLRIGGRTWTAVAKSTPDFEAMVDTQKAQITLVAGTVISLLLFTMGHTLVVRRQQALALAERMSAARTEAENRFQSLAESAVEAILVLDERGKVVFCNRSGGLLFGHAPSSIAGSELHELLALPPALDGWQELLRGGQRLQLLETLAHGGGGSPVPIEVSLGTWATKDGRYFSAIVHDISGRKVAEAQLRQAKADLRSIIDGVPAMVGSWDAQLRNRFCNKEYRDWFGIDPKSAEGKHYADVLGEKLYLLNRPHIDAALRGERQSFERTITSPTGRTRQSEAHYIPDIRDGVVQGFFVLVFDITARKEIEHALEYGLRLHDVIFTHAGVGIACERDGHLERVSRRCTELLGYGENELDDFPTSTLFPDKDSYQRVCDFARDQLASGRTLDHELMLRRKDGSSMWCRLMARAVEPSDPTQGTIWIIDDFSDRKQREDLLEAARTAAEDAAHLKSEFLANMSHEIRTPMNAIIGMTHLTLETELDDSQRENLLMVQDSAAALLRLLNDILDFSKMEAGKMQLSPEDFDLREHLAATLQRFALQASTRGLELVLDVAPDVPERLWGDSGRLMQVVTNLCSNAIKFTESGQVVCRVEVAGTAAEDTTLEFSVIDSGIGIPESARERIFESFVQADNSVTRRYGGTGLGLAICSQIVALMNGRIQVESRTGAGSRFFFTTTMASRSAPPATPASELAVLAGRSVAVAGGNEAARAAAARLLRAWQLQPVEFASVEAALAAAQLAARFRAGYPAIVVDAVLWDAAQPQVREQLQALPGAPSIILLGAERGKAAQTLPFVRKPLRHTDLRAALLAALGSPRALNRAKDAPPPGHAARRAVRALRVLVAEDHPLNQRLAQRVLERRGHHVTLVADGAKAFAAATDASFDVILMDVQMPVMDGVAATQAIRAAERGSGVRVPIIALTAHALKGERERLLGAGMDNYLSKPYDPNDLVRAVEGITAERVEQASAADTVADASGSAEM